MIGNDSGVGSEHYQDDDHVSITSSTYQHRYGKRRFNIRSSKVKCRQHGVEDNPYTLPNDEDEKERLDLLQYCCSTLMGGNVIPPISSRPTQIGTTIPSYLTGLMAVDIGTGSGAWVIEVAHEYILTRVIGTDLSPIQLEDVPENVTFIVADLVKGLNFAEGSTDLVNSR